MSVQKQRINAIQALINGSVIANSPLFSRIAREYNDVLRVNKIKPLGRRRILQVLHSTRGLDSALSAFTTQHGCLPIKKFRTLGGYLSQLTRNNPSLSKLSHHEKSNFQKDIVELRNRYMHEAGAYPTSEAQVLGLLSDMESCLLRVLNL